MLVNLVENGFEINECRQNFKCFDETFNGIKDIPLPFNKVLSSLYFIILGAGIFMAANFRISFKANGLPIVVKWNHCFSAFGGILVSNFDTLYS